MHTASTVILQWVRTAQLQSAQFWHNAYTRAANRSAQLLSQRDCG